MTHEDPALTWPPAEVLRQAVAQSFNSVLITDADFAQGGPHIIFCNEAFCQMTGYTQAELLGQSPRILQGPQTDQSVIEELRACLREGRFFHGMTYNYRKDGEAYFVEWNISPIRNAAGVITHYISMQQNLTEQIEAQRDRELLAFALNETQDPVFMVDQDGHVVFVNKAYEALTRMSCNNLRGNYPPGFGATPGPITEFRAQLAGGKAFKHIVQAGADRHLEHSLTPLRIQSAQITHFVGVVRDITEQVLREQGLAHTVNAQARQIEVMSEEDRMAAEVYRYMTQQNPALAGIDLWTQCASRLCGDLAIWARLPDGSLYVCLMDAMGHGAPAAISLLPVALKFREMVAQSLPMAEIIGQCNALLHEMLPAGHFVAAVFMAITPQSLEIWNAGMPDTLLFSSDGHLLQTLPSRLLALGITAELVGGVEPVSIPMTAPLRFILLASDGFLEQPGPDGEHFAGSNWSETMFTEIGGKGYPQASDCLPLHCLCARFEHFREGVDMEDDATLLQVDLLQLGVLQSKIAYQPTPMAS